MTQTQPATRAREPELLPALDDPRVGAVLAVLRGASIESAAQQSAVEPDVLGRWVGVFVTAGVAAVVDRPDPLVALQRQRLVTAVKTELREPLARARDAGRRIEGADTPDVAATQVARLNRSLATLDERVGDAELLVAAALGALPVRREPVTVAATCADLPGLEEIHGRSPDHVVDVDPLLLRRVLRDVWAVAGWAPDANCRRMHVRHVGPWVVWRVLRSGEPLDPVRLHALFEPFDHERTDSRTDAGGGLGLYLARALAVAQGGLVGVDQDDTGASFWVRIPASSSSPPGLRPVPPPRSTR